MAWTCRRPTQIRTRREAHQWDPAHNVCVRAGQASVRQRLVANRGIYVTARIANILGEHCASHVLGLPAPARIGMNGHIGKCGGSSPQRRLRRAHHCAFRSPQRSRRSARGRIDWLGDVFDSWFAFVVLGGDYAMMHMTSFGPHNFASCEKQTYH